MKKIAIACCLLAAVLLVSSCATPIITSATLNEKQKERMFEIYGYKGPKDSEYENTCNFFFAKNEDSITRLLRGIEINIVLYDENFRKIDSLSLTGKSYKEIKTPRSDCSKPFFVAYNNYKKEVFLIRVAGADSLFIMEYVSTTFPKPGSIHGGSDQVRYATTGNKKIKKSILNAGEYYCRKSLVGKAILGCTTDSIEQIANQIILSPRVQHYLSERRLIERNL